MSSEPSIERVAESAARTRSVWVKAGILVALLAVGGIAVLYYGVPDIDGVRRYVESMGVWAPVAYVVGFVLITTTPFPKSVFCVLAGILWGMGAGVAIGVLSALLGASLSFWVARRLGRDAVLRVAGPRLTHFDVDIGRRGWLAVLAIRLVPVLPFTLLNYAFGITSVRFAAFFAGTAIGVIPGTAAYVAVGAFGASPYSWQFWLAVGCLGALTVVGYVAHRRRKPAPTAADELDEVTQRR